jgi:hypothetical protein
MPIFTELTHAQRHYVRTSRKMLPKLYNKCENPLNKHTAPTMSVFHESHSHFNIFVHNSPICKRITIAANTRKIPFTPLSRYMSYSAPISMKIVTVQGHYMQTSSLPNSNQIGRATYGHKFPLLPHVTHGC